MKRLFSVCLLVSLFVSSGHAGPTEAAIMATMRLSEQPSYSWVATISDDARTYDIMGQTMRGGYTRVKMPVINSVRRQLGRSVTDTHVDMIFRGNVDCVIETDDGWKKPNELARGRTGDRDSPHLGGATGHSPLLGARPGSIHRGSMRPAGLPPRNEAAGRDYSNLQLAISHPHEDLGVIVSSHVDFRVDGNIVTGSLTDLGAQLLLVRDGQDTITPLRASGTFKLWLRDGMVVKYQVRLEGTLDIQSRGTHRQVNVNQVTDTVLKDVGTTLFDVPSQARSKLGT
jgi:hypothetical protein